MAAPKNPATKYSEAAIAKLLETIKETGSLKSAWKAIGIHKTTYYEWLRTYPPLVGQVGEAMSEFQRNVEAEDKEQAYKVLQGYLYGKMAVVNDYEIERVEELVNTEGEAVAGTQRRTTEKKRVKTTTPCPVWVIERLLGKRLELSDAIATFTAFGYKVTKTNEGFVITDESGITGQQADS